MKDGRPTMGAWLSLQVGEQSGDSEIGKACSSSSIEQWWLTACFGCDVKEAETLISK